MAKYETNLFETSEIEYCEGNSLVDHAFNSTTYNHYSHFIIKCAIALSVAPFPTFFCSQGLQDQHHLLRPKYKNCDSQLFLIY